MRLSSEIAGENVYSFGGGASPVCGSTGESLPLRMAKLILRTIPPLAVLLLLSTSVFKIIIDF